MVREFRAVSRATGSATSIQVNVSFLEIRRRQINLGAWRALPRQRILLVVYTGYTRRRGFAFDTGYNDIVRTLWYRLASMSCEIVIHLARVYRNELLCQRTRR
jgi:hypothetical protein